MPTSRQVRVPLSSCSANPRSSKKEDVEKKTGKPRKWATKPFLLEEVDENQANASFIPPSHGVDDKEKLLLLSWENPNISIVQIFKLFWDEQAIELE